MQKSLKIGLIFAPFLLAAILQSCSAAQPGAAGSSASATTPTPTATPVPWAGVKQLGVAGQNTITTAVSADSEGSVYVTGYTSGGLDGNTSSGGTDFFITKYDLSGVKQWTKQLGVASKSTRARAIAIDASNNIYIAGETNGGLDGNTNSGGNANDFFLAKYNSAGTKQWTKQLGVASQNTPGYGVAVDASGNIYVSGYTNGGLDGNSVTGTNDLFLTKYDNTGAKQWTQQLGVSGKNTFGYKVALDSSGNAFVQSYTNGNLDGNTLTGTYDSAITKYSPGGVKQWTVLLGGATFGTFANGIAIDSSGNIFLAGSTEGGLNGNSQTGVNDFFLAKFNSSGVRQWTSQMGVATKNSDAFSVTVDSSGNIFAAGVTNGGLDGNTLTGSSDLYVTKYNTSGARQWTRQYGDAAPSTQCPAYGVSTDSSGSIFAAGFTNSGLDGNSQTGGQDLYIIKYDSAGVKQ